MCSTTIGYGSVPDRKLGYICVYVSYSKKLTFPIEIAYGAAKIAYGPV
jgi:hypothetical protein